MGYILTLVGSARGAELAERHLDFAESVIGQRSAGREWLRLGVAADLFFEEYPDHRDVGRLAGSLTGERIDVFLQSDRNRRKRLLISDMDCTMVIGETLDDLADQCGLKAKIAPITERAMRGEINFQEALRERVGMLRGLEIEALEATRTAIRLMPGAAELVGTMRQHGATCILVSGGFAQFAESVAEELGFHASHANRLLIESGKLTGAVADPIIDQHQKRLLLEHWLERLDIPAEEALAIGDGANDLEMLSGAGLGVGFHPKSYLRQRITNSIVHGDLTALLYLQGYTDWE